MKHTLLISFDLIRPGEVKQAFAIGSLMAYAKSLESYGKDFVIHPIGINIFDAPSNFDPDYFEHYFNAFHFEDIDTIAISAYIWSEYLVNPLLKYIRGKGYKNKFVLGGYQISYSNPQQLIQDYPDCDIFISGYAEYSLIEAILSDKQEEKTFLNHSLDFSQLPSPYLTGELAVPMGQQMVRFESKRGCPFRCTFCAHRDLLLNKVYKHGIDKIYKELAYFRSKNIKRVNILDPVYNQGSYYLDILREIDRLHFQNTTFTLQTRFELIRGTEGETFLTLAEKTNAHLEFGIQSIIPEEYKVVNRPNKPDHISKLFYLLNTRGISYEVSLIYGLPNQTVDSFKHSIDFVKEHGCNNITAYPLMLLKGTELYHDKDKWNIREAPVGEFQIPTVISSNTFSHDDWHKMREIAHGLHPNDRL